MPWFLVKHKDNLTNFGFVHAYVIQGTRCTDAWSLTLKEEH